MSNCTLCGSNAYIGFSTVECSNPKCMFGDQTACVHFDLYIEAFKGSVQVIRLGRVELPLDDVYLEAGNWIQKLSEKTTCLEGVTLKGPELLQLHQRMNDAAASGDPSRLRTFTFTKV